MTWAIFLPLWLVPDLLVGLSGGALLDDLLAGVAIGYGMRLFSLGLVDTHYLVLDLSLVFLFLFLCAQVIDSNRWR